MATRLWHGFRVPDADVAAAAGAAAERVRGRPGRVQSGGTLVHAQFEHVLRGALPGPLSEFLRTTMEWYGCRGAFFHNDAHYDGVLFGVWCILGPPRELVFPRIGRRVSAAMGSMAVFDPFEPHAVLGVGADAYRSEDYEQDDVSVFLGFEVELAPAVRGAFGIGAPHREGMTWSSRIAINPATGAAATSGA